MERPPTDPEFTRQSSLGYQINHLARRMAVSLAERIAPHGVVPGQFAQLLALYEHDRLSASELARLVAIEQPTMSRTLSRMERDGLITRQQHPTDRRRQQILLTDFAKTIEPDLKRAASEVNHTYLSALNTEQQHQLLSLLSTVINRNPPA